MIAVPPALDLSQTSAILTNDDKNAKLLKEVKKEMNKEMTYEQEEKIKRDRGEPLAHIRYFFRSRKG